MKTAVLLATAKAVPKSYFSVHDLARFYPGKKDALKVVLSRLSGRHGIHRLARGYYALDPAAVDWEQFACELVMPSYISLEYALNRHGILGQVPMRITLITLKKGREFDLTGQTLEYSHITPALYFGCDILGHVLMARPEKALLDELYLISLRRRHLGFGDLDLSGIDRKLFGSWLKKYPPFTRRLAARLGL